jgi:hypothetical protein
MPVPRRLRLPVRAVVLVLLMPLLALGARRSAEAQAALPQFSPEQAMVELAPLRLRAADLPAGYQPQTPSYFTPSGESVLNTPPGGDPHRALDLYSNEGYVVWTSQRLSGGSATLPAAYFYAYFMKDVRRARDRTDGRLDGPHGSDSEFVDDVSVQSVAGDATSIWHLVSTDARGVSSGGYLVRWQRGRLAFTISTAAPFGKEKLDDALALLAAIDKAIVVRMVPDSAVPDVAPPASESERIDAALRLRTIDIGDDAAPDGFLVFSHGLIHPAGSVLASSNPIATLRQQDQQFRRVIAFSETFLSLDDPNNSGLRLVASLHADTDGALADFTALSAPNASTGATPIAPPMQAGDAIAALRFPQVQAGTAKTELDEVIVYWLHGPLLLSVSLVAAPDVLTDDFIAGFAQQAEAAYQASAFAASPAATAPQSAGAMPTDAVLDLAPLP